MGIETLQLTAGGKKENRRKLDCPQREKQAAKRCDSCCYVVIVALSIFFFASYSLILLSVRS